jgi:hypothetical protein
MRAFVIAFLLLLEITLVAQRSAPLQVPLVKFPGLFVASQQITAEILEAESLGVREIAVQVSSSVERRLLRKSSQDLAWQPLRNTVQIDLGPGDGERLVSFAFKGSDGVVRWRSSRIVLDTTGPILSIQSPQGTVLSDTTIDIRGVASEILGSITVKLPEAGIPPLVILTGTTNHAGNPRQQGSLFECLNVPLAPGANRITIHCTDLIGNPSTLELELQCDPHSDRTAPTLEIDWPVDGEEINARALRVRGKVSERNAAVFVYPEGAGPIRALVERDGHFWAYGVPLHPGTNSLRVATVDPAGNASEKILAVIRSAIEVTIDPIRHPGPPNQRITVTGTINDPNCTVWVNGTKAEMHGLTWTAKGVAINPETGTAIVQAIAIPNNCNGGNGYGIPTRPTLKNMGNPRLRP